AEQEASILKSKSLEKVAKSRCFQQHLGKASESFALRISARFHHPKFAVAHAALTKVRHEPLKKFSAMPIVSGVPPVYDPDGEAFYVSLKELRAGNVNLE